MMKGLKRTVSVILVGALLSASPGVNVFAGKDGVSESNHVVSDNKKSVFISSGGGALTHALAAKDFTKAKEYIRKRKDFYQLDDNFRTPLHYAVRLGNLEIVKMLVENGAEVNAFDKFAQIPLSYSDDEEISDYLIKNGAMGEYVEMNRIDSKGDSLLKKYVQANDINKVKELLEKGANPDILDYMGRNVLCFCTTVEMAKILVKAKLNFNIAGCDFNSPVKSAIRSHNFKVFKFFLDKTEQYYQYIGLDGLRILLYTVEVGDLEIFKYFYEVYFVQPWKNLDLGSELLCEAAKHDKGEFIDYILSKGADVNVKNVDGKTPLHVAMEKGNLDICRKLIFNGAKVNICNDKGKTPFDVAKNRAFLKRVVHFLNTRNL